MKTLSKTEILMSCIKDFFLIVFYICLAIESLNLVYTITNYLDVCKEYKKEQIEESKLMQDQSIQYLNEVGYNFNRK